MRELRNEIPGWGFCLAFVANLLFTNNYFMGKLMTFLKEGKDIGLSVILAVFVIFGAPAIGYIFCTIVTFYFGDYSKLWKNKEYFDTTIREELKNRLKDKNSDKFKKISEFSEDSFFSLYWQGIANKEIIEWVSRRFTVYFVNLSIILGMAVGYIISLPIVMFEKTFSLLATLLILDFCFIISYYLLKNGQRVKKEAMVLIAIWQARAFDETFFATSEIFEKRFQMK